MRRLGLAGVGMVLTCCVLASGASAQTTSAPIGAFPMPGTQSASPETQISLRGAAAGVAGDGNRHRIAQSARTRARCRPHSDGNGASFVLSEPLRGGETVTVRTDLDIAGARNGDYTFKTVSRPRRGLGSGVGAVPNLELLQELTGQVGTAPTGAVRGYRSRPDLRPPEVEVRTSRSSATGYVFIAPKKVFGARDRPGLQSGPLIVDGTGEPVWFAADNTGNVTDFRVQQLGGRPVLTWWQGRAVLGTGEGVVQVVDGNYRPVTTIRGGNGYALDFHETTITPQGTLLSIVYNPVRRDLRFIGGPREARVIDSVIQEIDIATGLVLFEWHSLGTIGLRESYGRVPGGTDPLFDYVHANSVADDPGRRHHRLRPRESGPDTSSTASPAGWSGGSAASAATTAWSARRSSRGSTTSSWCAGNTLRIFDNEAAPRVRDESRALFLSLDDARMRATVSRVETHVPNALRSGTQGNVQGLADGGIFVGWGSQGYFTQYDGDGDVAVRRADRPRAGHLPRVPLPVGRDAGGAARDRGDERRPQRLRELERGDRGRPLGGARRRLGDDPRTRGLSGAQRVRDPDPDRRRRVRGRARAGCERRRARHVAGDRDGRLAKPYAAFAAASSQVCRRACRMMSAG